MAPSVPPLLLILIIAAFWRCMSHESPFTAVTLAPFNAIVKPQRHGSSCLADTDTVTDRDTATATATSASASTDDTISLESQFSLVGPRFLGGWELLPQRHRKNPSNALLFRGGSSGAPRGVVHVANVGEYEAVVASANAEGKLIVLDFTANWCMPCKMIAPVFAQLATSEEYGSSAIFVKVDVDEASDVAEKFAVMSMPTFVFVKNGKIVDRFSGASVEKLTQTLVANI